jgi:hypothetical protein
MRRAPLLVMILTMLPWGFAGCGVPHKPSNSIEDVGQELLGSAWQTKSLALERFPRVYVRQSSYQDCWAACASMVLRFHGRCPRTADGSDGCDPLVIASRIQEHLAGRSSPEEIRAASEYEIIRALSDAPDFSFAYYVRKVAEMRKGATVSFNPLQPVLNRLTSRTADREALLIYALEQGDPVVLGLRNPAGAAVEGHVVVAYAADIRYRRVGVLGGLRLSATKILGAPSLGEQIAAEVALVHIADPEQEGAPPLTREAFLDRVIFVMSAGAAGTRARALDNIVMVR